MERYNAVMVSDDELEGGGLSASERSPCQGYLYPAADRIRKRVGEEVGDSKPSVHPT